MATETINLTVEGMSCQHCVMSVQKAVGALKGVSGVQVDLAAKRVTVGYDPGLVDLAAIRAAIDDQGYEVVG